MPTEIGIPSLFVDISDETALVVAAHLVESAAFNLAPKLSATEAAELIEIALRLTEYADCGSRGIGHVRRQHRRPN